MAIQYDPPLELLMDFFCLEPEGHRGWPEGDIQDAEARVGATLPPAYREFLMKYGQDGINSHFNQLQEPRHIHTTYQAIQEELPEWEPEFREALQKGTGEQYKDHDYFRLWQLPADRWAEVTENYVIIWYENQGVWSAGFRLRDLLDGNPDPPVYMSTEDDYITYGKIADNVGEFLREMLRQAAYGWKGAPRYTSDGDIRAALNACGVDPEALRPRTLGDGNAWLATFLDMEEELAGFCFAAGEYQELCLPRRKPPKAPTEKRVLGNRGPQEQSDAHVLPPPETLLTRCRPLNRGPYRLALEPFQKKDLGMEAPRPENGVALHPLIALMVQEAFHREPATAYDWDRDLGRMKTLRLELRYGTRRTVDPDTNEAYIYPPGEHFPPSPYYFDLQDWTIISRMTSLRTVYIDSIIVEDDRFWPALAKLPNLRNLTIQSTWVGDFGFLRDCKGLTRLSVYNTGFSDCRILLDLPKLQEADLRFCPLEHKEVLPTLPCKLLGYPNNY